MWPCERNFNYSRYSPPRLYLRATSSFHFALRRRTTHHLVTDVQNISVESCHLIGVLHLVGTVYTLFVVIDDLWTLAVHLIRLADHSSALCCHAHLGAYCIMFGLSILIALVRTGKYFTLNSNRARLSRAASRFPFAFLASRSRHGLSSTDYIKLHSKNITKRLLREGEREDERAKRAACMRPAETSGSVMLNFAHIR